MSDTDNNANPSLLESESRGGDTGEGGISFQASVVLSYIPKWLAIDGFTSMVREGIGDTEAKFFIPGRGFRNEFLEVKDYSLTPAKFWLEIDRFKKVDAGAPGEYQWFTLAVTGLSQDLRPLANSLRRIRDPYDFYEGTAIMDNSYEEYVKVVQKLDRSAEDADFLYRKVLIVDDLSMNEAHARAVFKQSVRDHLPSFQDLPDRVLNSIYDSLGTFIQSRRNQTITRKEIEEKIREHIPSTLQPPTQPVRIHTATSDQEKGNDKTELQLSWAPFFGGMQRDYPSPDVWNNRLLGDLRETKEWILKYRVTRRIRLSGNRRLSASLAIGSVFSAVSGFSIDLIYRDDTLWSTDAHPDENTLAYELIHKGNADNHKGEQLVVSVGIIRSITDEVDNFAAQSELAGMPTLHIESKQPIVTPQQANLVVRGIKDYISDAVERTGAKRVDLFIAGPAFLALFLGHRLNATIGQVQCYERVEPGQYVQTCLLLG